jgi:biotin transport system ATP-binding protein
LIEFARREAPPAGRLHLRAAAAGIIFEQVLFRRADRQVLAIPELCLDERRIGLIGDNGSGKSTMWRLMNGLLLPTRGRVHVAGLDTVRHRKDLPAKIGFLFQNPDHQLIFPTVAEEVAFGPTECGIRRRRRTGRRWRCWSGTAAPNGQTATSTNCLAARSSLSASWRCSQQSRRSS